MPLRVPLGELLINTGWLTRRQLSAALDAARRSGQRLGSTLCEMGLLDAGSLSKLLGAQRGVAFVEPSAFAQIEPEVLRRIPSRLARKYKAIPLRLSARDEYPGHLQVAMLDPDQSQVIEALTSAARMPIDPVIAPQRALLAELERLYPHREHEMYELSAKEWRGLVRVGEHLVRIGERFAHQPEAHLTIRPTPSGGALFLLGRGEALVAPPAPLQPPRDRPSSSVSGPLWMDSQMIEVVDELDLESVLTAQLVPPESSSSGSHYVEKPPIQIDALIETIENAGNVSTIADALLRAVRDDFAAFVMFVVSEGVARAYRGYSNNASEEVVEGLVLPLGEPSALQAVEQTGEHFVGPPLDHALEGRLWRLLGSTRPDELIIAPVRLGPKTVNLLYGHPPQGGWIRDEAVDAVRRAAEAIGVKLRELAMSQVVGVGG